MKFSMCSVFWSKIEVSGRRKRIFENPSQTLWCPWLFTGKGYLQNVRISLLGKIHLTWDRFSTSSLLMIRTSQRKCQILCGTSFWLGSKLDSRICSLLRSISCVVCRSCWMSLQMPRAKYFCLRDISCWLRKLNWWFGKGNLISL